MSPRFQIRAQVRSLLEALFRRSALEERIDSELRAHVEAYTDDLVRSGMPRAEAERRAHLEFGGVEGVKEECRDARGLRWADELRQNIRYAFRTFRKAPGFATAAVLSLALGIGANTAIFSVVDAALLRPLPYRDPGRLVAIWENHTTRGERFDEFANANFVDLRANTPSLEGIAASMPFGVTLTGSGDAERLHGRMVTPDAFALLGAGARLGRALIAADGQPGSARVIVLSYELWQRKFGGDTGVVGRALRLEGNSYTVAGVMPQSFRYPGAHDEFWLPLTFDARERQERSNHNLECIGRLKPGATVRRAQAEASFLARRLRRAYPVDNDGIDFYILPLRESLTHDVRSAMIVLLAAVGLLFLIACANVGNLILTRSTVRRHELAVRVALGAGRWRLIRQMLTESLCLAAVGGLAALAICVALTKVARTQLPAALVPVGEIRVDNGVLVFGLIISVVAGLLCAVAPALLAARRDLQGALAESSRSTTGSGSEMRTRGALVAGEVALTVILLIAAGLLLRSFVRLMDVDPGFKPDHVLAVRFVLPPFLYSTDQARVSFYRRLLDRVNAAPGVVSAALNTSLPFVYEGGSSWFIRENRPTAHPDELIAVNRLVSVGYFRTLGIPLREGRLFTSHDGAGAPLVAVINQTMARKFWPGEDPIGKRFQFYDKPWVQIVGIVGDVHQVGLAIEPAPEIYRPFVQDDQSWLAPRALVIRTRGEPTALAPDVRQLFQSLDRGVPIYGIDAMNALLGKSVASSRFEMALVGSFGILALLLASIGIYGVVSYVVAQRRQEIGVRMALGATRGDVVAMMLRSGLRPVLAGLLVGLALAFASSRLLTSQLYGIPATDAATYVAVPLLLAFIASCAAYFPSRRAARIDPMLALRHE